MSETIAVELTAEELLLLRVRLSGAYTRTTPVGFGVPAVDSVLDAKLSAAQRAPGMRIPQPTHKDGE